MPDGPKYYQKIYSNLVEYYGKGSLPDEKTFYQKLSNSDYRKGVFSNLVEAYGQDALPSYNDFEKRIEAPAQIDISPRPAKRAEGLPTFAEQQASLAQYKNPYERAIDRDKASWSAALKTAYNGVVGGTERLLGGIIEIAPSPYALPQEFVKLQKAKAKEDIKAVYDVARMEVTPEEQQALAFDIKNKGVLDNVKSLVGMSGQVFGDIALGAATAGTSFFIQAYNDGVNEYDESAKKAGVIPNDASRVMFGAVSGTINGLLEKFALNKIFGTGPALKNLQRKALVETFDEVLKSGKGLTIEALEKTAEKNIRNLAATVRTKGVKTLYASRVEGLTEGIQSGLTDIAKNVTNEVEGRKVFDNVGLKQSIDNFINNTAAGFLLGAPMGAVSAFNTNVDNQLLKDVAKAQTPEQFENITRDLTQTFEKANIPQEQRDAIINKMAEYVDVKNTIPAYTPAEVQQKVIPIILQRRGVDAAISEKEAAIEKLDESLKDDVQVEIDMLRDRRSYMNDQIRESVSEDKFSYFEENGRFFKKLGENKPEEISKNYFEMAFVGEKQKDDKPQPTDKNITPFIVVDGETYAGKDHGEAMEKAREAGENVPDPATEEGKVWREENGLFKDSFGQTLTRDESQQEYGVRNSADIIKEEPFIIKQREIESKLSSLEKEKENILASKKPKAILVDEIKKDIGSLAGEQMDVRTEKTRKILNAYRKIFGFPPYEGSMSDDKAYTNAFNEANSYYSSEVRRRLNRLELASEYILGLANTFTPKAVEAEIDTRDIDAKIEAAKKELDAIKLAPKQEVAEVIPEKGYAASTMQKIRREEALKTIDEIGTPIDARQAAWLALAQGTKVGRESFIRETRLGQGEVLKNKLLLKGGQTIEKASESIHANLPDEMQDVIYQPDIRNELIDLLQTYNTKEEARRAYIDFYSKRLTAIEDVDAMMEGVDEVVFLDDIAYSKNQYDEFLRDVAELEEPIRVSDEYVNILMQENEQDAQREGEQAAPEAEGKPAEPVVGPISVEEAGKAVGEYVRRFGTDEEIPAFDEYLKTETTREGFDAEYRENRRAGESKEEYVYRKYCK